MDVIKIRQELKKKAKDARIDICDRRGSLYATAYIDPYELHPEYSTWIQVVDILPMRKHNNVAIIVFALKGTAYIASNGKEHRIEKDSFYIVPPNTPYSIRGSSVWVEIYAEPGLSSDNIEIVSSERESKIAPLQTMLIIPAGDIKGLLEFYQKIFNVYISSKNNSYIDIQFGQCMLRLYDKTKISTLFSNSSDLKNTPIFLSVENLKTAQITLEQNHIKYTVNRRSLIFKDSESNLIYISENNSNSI